MQKNGKAALWIVVGENERRKWLTTLCVARDIPLMIAAALAAMGAGATLPLMNVVFGEIAIIGVTIESCPAYHIVRISGWQLHRLLL